MDLPKVSIVIVNYNGIMHLKECLSSILRLNYPQELIEIVIVDNNSTDGSVELLRDHYGWVKLLRNNKNEGFAKPCNDGVKIATGEYVAFLNNDMRVQKDWLIELIHTLRNHDVKCAGSLLLNWNGKLLDFAGGSISFYGCGYQYHFHEPIKNLEEDFTEDRELLFACGGAMIVDRQVFLGCGGFDEDYFAYFEDLDLGWRLRILGYKTMLSVKSRAFHKHHGTSSRFMKERMQVLYERNKLYTIYKNYGDELLNKVFLPALLLDISSLYYTSGIDSDEFDLRLSHAEEPEDQTISSESAAQLCALNAFISHVQSVTKKRKFIQEHRKVDDREIIPLIPDPFIRLGKEILPFNKFKYELARTFEIDKAFGMTLRPKVLLVCSDKIGVKMSGPAIRYYEFAKVLSKNCEVTLASFGSCDLTSDRFRIFDYTYQDYSRLIEAALNADIIVYQGFVCEFVPEFYQIAKDRYLVADMYDPYLIENVEVFKNHELGRRRQDYNFTLNTLNNQLKSGDFFICANEKQKDYWFGMLCALDRLTPQAYDYSRDGSKIVDIVPFGISDDKPEHNRKALKGVWPGIGENDKVIIWGGGVWNWFDPLTLIKAVKLVSEKRSDVRLFFMGVKSPNPSVPEMKMLNDAVELSQKLELYDKFVFFNFGWVDYNDRQNYLLESDIGVSCHFNTLETRFSFRTRILDYLWADLPIISTTGDHFSHMVESEHLGLTVDYEDPEGLAEAILKLLEDDAYYAGCKENIKRVAENFKWSKVIKPLEDFCMNPVHTSKALSQPDGKLWEIEKPAPISRVPVTERLERIERSLKSNRKAVEETDEKIEEIQQWTYIMSNRFSKLKKYANPFRLLRRLLKRG